MIAGILLVGDELIGGMVQDINSSYIAAQLDLAGWGVSAVLTVGDDNEAVKSGLEYLCALSDAVIVAGGLGPTADDITTAAVAAAFGLPLVSDERVLQTLKDRFAAFHISWTENNAKQALFPEGALVIENRVGTAAGFCLERDGKWVAVVPGVPGEAKKMVTEGVLPHFEKVCGAASEKKARKQLRLFGLSESKIDEAIGRLGALPGVTIGFYPRFPEVHLVLTARGREGREATMHLEEAEAKIDGVLHRHIIGYDDETLEGIVAALLTKGGFTLSVAESCTGGLIADRLTDIPGSSAFLERGAVVYSNLAKVELLGVPAEIIERYGAVSRETAELMARGMRAMAKTDLGLATTGIAGPSGGTLEKPVGTVYVALSDGEATYCRKSSFPWGRRRIKEISSELALEMLRRYLTGSDVEK